MTFKELKEICEKSEGSLFVVDDNYTDEVFFYYCLENEDGVVCLDIDSYGEDEIIHETAKEICANLSANDEDKVRVLYVDEFAEILNWEVYEGNVYLYTV